MSTQSCDLDPPLSVQPDSYFPAAVVNLAVVKLIEPVGAGGTKGGNCRRRPFGAAPIPSRQRFPFVTPCACQLSVCSVPVGLAESNNASKSLSVTCNINRSRILRIAPCGNKGMRNANWRAWSGKWSRVFLTTRTGEWKQCCWRGRAHIVATISVDLDIVGAKLEEARANAAQKRGHGFGFCR